MDYTSQQGFKTHLGVYKAKSLLSLFLCKLQIIQSPLQATPFIKKYHDMA